MVAPSFQTYKFIIAEPFTKDGKLYVTVEHPRTHNHRDVRWYTDQEYSRLYNKSKDKGEVHLAPEQKKFYKPAAVRSIEVSGTNPRIIKARVAADSFALARVLMWQACGALLQEGATPC